MFGVTVRCIGTGKQVGLLRSGRHARRRTAPLHVDDGDGDFRKVGQADELGHQRDARPRCGRERTRAVPTGTHDHADRSQFVLGLNDRVIVLTRHRIDPVFIAVLLKRLGHRGRRRDRVPRRYGRAAIDASQRGSTVAVGEDLVSDHVRASDTYAQGVFKVLLDKIPPQMQRLNIGRQQTLLALVLLGEQLLKHVGVHIQQHR